MSPYISCAACGNSTDGNDLCGACREVVRDYNADLTEEKEPGEVEYKIND